MRKPCPPRTLGRNAVSATVRAGSSSRPLRGVHRSAPSALLLDPIKRSRRCWVFARSGQPTWPHFVSQKTWFREIPRRVASTSRLLRNDVSALRLGGDVSVDNDQVILLHRGQVAPQRGVLGGCAADRGTCTTGAGLVEVDATGTVRIGELGGVDTNLG